MTGVSPGNVIILNVSDSSTRRRLNGDILSNSNSHVTVYSHLAATTLSPSRSSTVPPSAAILTSYIVSVSSHYSQSALQSQLTSATSSGFFDSQLTTYAQQFGAPAFVNASSSALVIITSSPTAAPISSSKGNSNNNLDAGAIAGLTIMSFVLAFAIAVCFYFYFYYDKSFKSPVSVTEWWNKLPKLPTFSERWSSREKVFDPFGAGRESTASTDRRTVVEFTNPTYVARQQRQRNQEEREGGKESERDRVEFVNPSFVNHPRIKKTKKEEIDIFL